MRRFIAYIIAQFKQPNNHLMQLCWIQIISFSILVILNILCYITGQTTLNIIYHQMTLSSKYSLLLYRPWGLITYGLLHKDGFHLLWHLLILRYLSGQIQTVRRSKEMFNTYLLGQLAGGIGFLLLHTYSPPFKNIATYLEGGSPAIYAILATTLVFIPYARTNLYITTIPLKYMVYALLGITLTQLLTPQAGVAIAQLSAALAGYLYAKYKQNRHNGHRHHVNEHRAVHSKIFIFRRD